MRSIRFGAIVFLLLAAAPPAAHADDARADWNRGLLIATGAMAGDMRAPSPAVARVGAEREAREQAQSRLLESARGLATASGQTVGEVADKDSAVADRLVRAAKQTLDLDIDYSSDGSVVLEAGLPIEAIRAAVHGPDSPPAAAQDGAMAALVIDARKLTVTPVVGISVTIGGERYRGPTIYALNAKSVAKDPRFKGKRTTVRATSYEAGALTLSGDESVVSEARGAGAAVVVLIKKMKP